MGEEMHVSIEKGKTIIIRLMAIGPVVEGSAQRDVWFEVNGEVRAVRRGQELGRGDRVPREVDHRPRLHRRAHVRRGDRSPREGGPAGQEG
jgi:pyruvate carboxylase